MEFICKKKCQYHSTIFNEGARLVVSRVVPCKCEGKDEKCKICKGTGRIDPPHHFTPRDPDAEAKQVAAAEASENAQIEALREELTAIGAAFDKRWKLSRLKEVLTEAKKERGL